MKIRVLSKQEFDLTMSRLALDDDNITVARPNDFFISINDTQGTSETPWFKQDHKNVLRLYFDDVTEDLQVMLPASEYPPCKVFTLEQANQVINFVEENKDKSVCLVHCAAGISRSGAVGMFINDFYGEQKFNEFMRNNPYINPNPEVTRLLKQVYNNNTYDKTN